MERRNLKGYSSSEFSMEMALNQARWKKRFKKPMPKFWDNGFVYA